VKRTSVGVRALILLAVAAAAALVPAAIQPVEPEVVPTGPRDLLIPASGALFGAFVGVPDPPNQNALEMAVMSLESVLGRRLAIDHHYYPWSAPFPSGLEQWDLDMGRVPMISWHGSDTEAIVTGSQDALIQARADAIRDLRRPVFLRWGWEMDGSRNSHWVRSPALFIAAWRHLHEVFVARGATNAVWVFCPGAPGFKTGHAQQFYPGSAEVDWVCADGYNWAPAKPGDPWQTFGQVFASFYSWAVTVGKPIMIGETGAVESTHGAKAKWIRNARRTMKRRMTSVRAFVYFDHSPVERGTLYNWRVDSSAPTLRSFTAMANDPYFTASPL
jgi:hypothetical protein